MGKLLQVLGLALLLLATPASAAELEHEVKAAFLYKFLLYVEWPPETFVSEDEPIVIAVLGSEKVHSALKEIVRGRVAQGRPVEVRLLEPNDDLSELHVVFVGHDSMGSLPRLVGRDGLLIVTEVEGGLERGAMINLLRVGDRVRFQIAPWTAEQRGLHISSRVLAVAQYVKPGPEVRDPQRAE